MKVGILFEDKGARSVTMVTEIVVPEQDEKQNQPTPAAILAAAVKALFENGQLARVGQVVLEGISLGREPSEYVRENFQEMVLNDTDP